MVKLYSNREDKYDPALTTPWTLIHFSVGVSGACIAKHIFPQYGFITGFVVFSLLHLCYEVGDLVMKDYSFLNSVGDQYFAMCAFVIVYLLPTFTPMVCGVLIALLVLIFVSPLTGKSWILPTDSWNGRG